jgi:FAD-dependent urate hydroxylase
MTAGIGIFLRSDNVDGKFWSQIAEASSERYLKSYCFGANISTPRLGYSFADYSEPRGLETFEPCSIGDFSAYGKWFQQKNVPWVEACLSG